jgi:hypothetical protein
MGKLAEIVIPTRSIKVGESSFDVQGLSLIILSTLIQDHLEDIDKAFELVATVRDNNTDDTKSFETAALSLIRDFPNLVAKLIVLAAGEDSEQAVSNAVSLPAPVQIVALKDIYELTVQDVGGIKKLWTMVQNLLETPKALSEPT